MRQRVMGQISRTLGEAMLLVIVGACSAVDLRPHPEASEPPPNVASSGEPSVAASESGGVTPDEAAVVQALVRFARTGDRADAAAIPIADGGVALGLSNRLMVTRSAEELGDARGWTLQSEAFRGYVGPFSAIRLLEEDRPIRVAAGPHPHCASPPVQPHPATVRLRQLSIQPAQLDTCLRWWTVDVFLDDGDVAAITMDLWEP